MGLLSRAAKAAGKALDMSTEARMARAKAMGFDTDRVLYHGTMKDAGRGAFVPSRGGELGPGTYVTRDPNLANDFARSSYGGDYREGAGVLPVYAPRLKEFPGVNEQGLMENGWAVERGKIMDRLRAENGGEWSSDIPMRAEMEMERIAREEGFAGFYVNGRGGMNQGVIFDPSNIRSIHAAFDPAKSKSSDLLAALAGVSLGGGLLSRAQTGGRV